MITLSDKRKIAEWRRHEKIIRYEFYRVFSNRDKFEKYKQIVTNNPAIDRTGAEFHNFVLVNYVTFIQAAIRRQAGQDRDEISLINLIKDIRDNSSILSREWYYYKFGDNMITKNVFNQQAGKRAAFNRSIAERDVKRLERASKKIRILCNRTVAHTSNNAKPKVTFDEVNKCLKVYEEILQRYTILLTGAQTSYLPISTTGWEAIFTQKWI